MPGGNQQESLFRSTGPSMFDPPCFMSYPSSRTQRSIHEERVEAAMQLKAALLGGSGVADLRKERLVEIGQTRRRLSGNVIKPVDRNGHREVLLRWYRQETWAIGWSMMMLTAASLFLSGILAFSQFRLGIVTSLAHAWPLGIAVGILLLRWPELTRPAALTFLALAVMRPIQLCELFAIHISRAVTPGQTLDVARSLFTPIFAMSSVYLAFFIIGIRCTARTWRSWIRLLNLSNVSIESQGLSWRRSTEYGLFFDWAVYALLLALSLPLSVMVNSTIPIQRFESFGGISNNIHRELEDILDLESLWEPPSKQSNLGFDTSDGRSEDMGGRNYRSTLEQIQEAEFEIGRDF